MYARLSFALYETRILLLSRTVLMNLLKKCLVISSPCVNVTDAYLKRCTLDKENRAR